MNVWQVRETEKKVGKELWAVQEVLNNLKKNNMDYKDFVFI